MIICKKVFLFFMFCSIVLLSDVQGQVSGCELEVLNTEFILESDYEITIIVEVQSNNTQMEGVAYLIDNIDLQSLGSNIFWVPATFSVNSDTDTFQIAISGSSTSIISIPDELELSGRIAFSFNEEPQVTTDIKLLEEGSVLFDNDIITLDVDTTIVIIDSSVVSIDTFLTPIDTFLTPIDTIYVEMDSLILLTDSLFTIDDSEILLEDSVFLSQSIILSDSILIGNQLIFLDDIFNSCEVSYICQLPGSTDQQVIVNEAKITNEDIPKNKIVNNYFGSIFDEGFLEMDELSFSVFPNPTVEYFYIHTNLNEKLNIVIYAATGNIVFEKTMDSNFTKIDTQNLPDGIYFVLLENNAEVRHLTKLLVK